MSSGTIVALATPTGRSGIGVIRMSGSHALGITRKLVNDQQFSPETRYATLKQLHDPFTNEVIDEAIITYFKAPHSFTGEDVVEISCHGSPVLLRQVIDICLRLDARMAEAGEFSLRALANGRMNLAQAEAIRDLIDAQTTASARQASVPTCGAGTPSTPGMPTPTATAWSAPEAHCTGGVYLSWSR